jgi:hypothetical protein
MKKYYLKSSSKGIFYMKYADVRLTLFVTYEYCVETAFCDRLLKEK